MRKLTLFLCCLASSVLAQSSVYRITADSAVPGSYITAIGVDGSLVRDVPIPAKVAETNLVTQSATLTTQTLYTPTANGVYRIYANAVRTRAATTSSTLGALTITWTDIDTNASLTYTVAMITSAGAIATTNANNLTTVTGSCVWLPLVVYAKSGVAITYTLTYASSGATTMQYAFRIRCEKL